MKPYKNILVNTIILAIVVGIVTACGSPGGGDSPDTSPNDPGAGDGSLSVANAPVSVEGSFIVIDNLPDATIVDGALGVGWLEKNAEHSESLSLKIDLTTGSVLVLFGAIDGAASEFWACDDHLVGYATCNGITIDKTVGIVTFANQVLITTNGSSVSPVTLNGTLEFTPPGGSISLPGTGTFSGNNSALLNGVVIGSDISPVGDLRKPITVTVLGVHPSFSVGTAYATRPSVNTDYAYTFLPVTNIGSQTQCFVVLSGIAYRDASDVLLSSNGITYVQGSVAKLPSSSFTNTCLDPGETGMAATITANIYSTVTKMEFTLGSSGYAVSSPTASVIPQSYILQPATSTFYAGTLSISALNIGLGSALVGEQYRFHSWFLFDGTGQPLAYGLTDSASPTIVPVNGTAMITGDVWYEGSGGSELLVFVDFEDTTVTASLVQSLAIAPPALEVCSATLPTDELMLCRNESRNQQLDNLKLNYAALSAAQ